MDSNIAHFLTIRIKQTKAKIPYMACGYGRNETACKQTRAIPYVRVGHTIRHAAAYGSGYGKLNRSHVEICTVANVWPCSE